MAYQAPYGGHQPPYGGGHPSAPNYPPPPSQSCPPGYGQPPPGYGAAQPTYGIPPAYGAPPPQKPQQYPVVNYPQPQPKRSKGLFGGLIDDLSRGLSGAARDVGNFTGKTFSGDIMSLFSSGSVLQLYYKKTGCTLQIVNHPTDNRLIVDVMGSLSPQAYHAHWFVYREMGNIVKLYNQDNFLGNLNGYVTLFKAPNPLAAGLETRWKVIQSASSDNVASLESMCGTGLLAVGPDERSVVIEDNTSLSPKTYFEVKFVTKIM